MDMYVSLALWIADFDCSAFNVQQMSQCQSCNFQPSIPAQHLQHHLHAALTVSSIARRLISTTVMSNSPNVLAISWQKEMPKLLTRDHISVALQTEITCDLYTPDRNTVTAQLSQCSKYYGGIIYYAFKWNVFKLQITLNKNGHV